MSSLAYSAQTEITPLNLGRQIQHWTPAVLLSLCLNLLTLQLATYWNTPREIRIPETALQIQFRAMTPTPKQQAMPVAPATPPRKAPKEPLKKTPASKPVAIQPEKKLSVPPVPRPAVKSISTPPPKRVLEPLPSPKPIPAVKQQTPKPVALHKLSRMPGFALKVSPSYPEEEHDSGKEASVLVEVLISHAGELREINILKSGGSAFDEAVLAALRKSTFTPGYVKYEAVAVRIQIPFRFQLD